MGKEEGRAFDGGIEGEKVLHQANHSGFIKTGLLMFKWQGLYLRSDMLPNGGGKKEKHALSGQHSGEENSLSKPWLAPNQCCNLRLNHRKGCRRVHTKCAIYSVAVSSVSAK